MKRIILVVALNAQLECMNILIDSCKMELENKDELTSHLFKVVFSILNSSISPSSSNINSKIESIC